MTIAKIALTSAKFLNGRSVTTLLLLLFALIPFQRRFHGVIDSFSRKLTLPDFPLPPFFSKHIHLYIADPLILIVALLLLFRFKTPWREFFFQGPSKYLTLLFFAALASLLFSITATYSLQYFLLIQFSLVFLFFNSLCSAHHAIDLPKFIKSCAWVILLISCFQCLVGLGQYFCQSSIGLKFLGEIDISHFPFANPGKRRWLLDKLIPSTHSSAFLCRSSGTLTHPNVLGGLLFCSLMASYYLWMIEESRRKRLVILLTVPLQIFTLYTAYSRSALLALLFSTLFWCFLQIKRTASTQGFGSVGWKRYAILFSTVFAGLIAGVGLFYSQISARGGIFNYNEVTKLADSERIHYVKIALKMIEEHPWLGVGFNNFQLLAEKYQPQNTPNVFFAKVHNIYLLIASETGLIGGGLFFLFLLSILITASKAIFSKHLVTEYPQEKFFLAATFLGLLFIGVCDFYFLNTQNGRMLFFGIAALLYAICRMPAGGVEARTGG